MVVMIRKLKQKFSSRGSFNLVELSLAVAVTAIGIVSVFGILPHLLKSSRQAVEFSAITMDVQDFVDDPSHRGMLQPSDLTNESYFPTPPNSYRENVKQPGFEGQFTYTALQSTNADTTVFGYKCYTNFQGRPILKTLYMTYCWGATNNVTNVQRYTFITEACAMTNIQLK